MDARPNARRRRLYLDFDGVLNNSGFLRHQRNHAAQGQHRLFDPANIGALDALCTSLAVREIVVTSSWKVGRSVAELIELLATGGAGCAGLVVDTTPNLGSTTADRAREIRVHVSGYGGRWLALDDMDLAGGLPAGSFFRTSAASGLTLGAVDAIVELCNAGGHDA